MKFRPIFLCLICLAGLVACEVNTMYNARNYFKSAQEKPLNNLGKPNAQAIEEYTKAIKKCGIIISERKKGARLDDAYYLMSRALYYKGNSAFQAKDQFENLIFRFPNSPHVPEAHIFIARILREINQPREAEKKLDEFIRDPKYKKKHPQALFLMADFAIKDKNFNRAQYYLERIIDEYPKTKEYREAYFLFGKNYYEQKNFTASLQAFEKMQKARGIDKTLKMDGSYYIGLNLLELGDLDKGFRTAKSLVKNETRLDKIPAVRLLKARFQFALGDSANAKTELEYINKNFPRTESNAAAYYYLAEHQYYRASEVDKAVANYNRVRTEFSASPLSSSGQLKATALGKVKIPTTLKSETNLNQFLDHHYQAAESFLGALALPDSALARYRVVISEKAVLTSRRDSLAASLQISQAKLDSLLALVPAEQTPSDSLDISLSPADSLASMALVNVVDSILVSTDSLSAGLAVGDSLMTLDQFAIADSSKAQPDTLNPQVDLKAQIALLQTETTAMQTRITSLNELLGRFDAEIVPFCLFAIGSIVHEVNPQSPENTELLTQLEKDFTENKYTKALAALQKGKPIRLIDPLEERQELLLDSLFSTIEAQPDSAVVGLVALSNSEYPAIKRAATYRLGWYYSFEAVDTLAAKPFLDSVLKDTQAEEYNTLTRRFYNGTNFLLRDLPPRDSVAVDSTATLLQPAKWSFPPPSHIWETLPDSLDIYRSIPPLVDSLSYSLQPNKTNIQDSLQLYNHIPALVDSLSESLPQGLVPPVETPKQDFIPSETPVPPTPEVERKEETPLE